MAAESKKKPQLPTTPKLDNTRKNKRGGGAKCISM